MKNTMRTVIEFHKDGKTVRTVLSSETIPNVVVGQRFGFDHPSLNQVLSGHVKDISHVVFLGEELPITYIEVEINQ